MKRAVRKLTETEVLAEYPNAGLLPGWYFRLSENSSLAWFAEGTDLWGRLVSCPVEEGEIEPCVARARRIRLQIEGRGAQRAAGADEP